MFMDLSPSEASFLLSMGIEVNDMEITRPDPPCSPTVPFVDPEPTDDMVEELSALLDPSTNLISDGSARILKDEEIRAILRGLASFDPDPDSDGPYGSVLTLSDWKQHAEHVEKEALAFFGQRQHFERLALRQHLYIGKLEKSIVVGAGVGMLAVLTAIWGLYAS